MNKAVMMLQDVIERANSIDSNDAECMAKQKILQLTKVHLNKHKCLVKWGKNITSLKV